MIESLASSQQENLLTLLCFDQKALPVLIQNLDINLLESSLFRDVAQKAINFYNQYKKPIAEHLPDEFEIELNPKKGKEGKAKLLEELIYYLHDNQHKVNKEYTLNQLGKYIRQQQLKISVIKAAELLDKGSVDEAELVLSDCKKKQISVFEPGIFLHEHKKVLEFLDLKNTFIPTGISQLDDFGICPAPKELYTFAGLSGVGKTWWFIHLARIGLMLRKRVLLISLEMSNERLFQRFMQNFFAYAKRNDEVEIPTFIKDDLDRLRQIEFKIIKPRGIFQDVKKARVDLLKRLAKLKNQNLLVKSFPTRSLTTKGLRAYLENLINYTGFHPDIVLVDSPDNMHHDIRYKTDSLQHTFEDLRGMAEDYNFSINVASQINRGGKNIAWLDDEHLAGAFSKMWVSDNLISYNQTDFENQCNLARLLVVKGRNDTKGGKILISQNYSMGQFCLDSISMNTRYKNILKGFESDEIEEEL